LKLYLGSAIWRTEEEGFAQSARLLVRELDRKGIEFTEGFVVGDAAVDRSRSIVASAFLRSDADVLLTIDSDIWFRAADAISLAEKAFDYDIIAGLYMTRSVNTQPAMMLPGEPLSFEPNAEPIEVPFVPAGFTAIHRRVFEGLSETLPLCHKGWNDRGVDTSFWPFYCPFWKEWPGDGYIYLSEDWAMCERAKDAGFKVVIDPSIRLGHMGSYMYTLEDLVRDPKPIAQPIKLHRLADGELKIYTAQEV